MRTDPQARCPRPFLRCLVRGNEGAGMDRRAFIALAASAPALAATPGCVPPAQSPAPSSSSLVTPPAPHADLEEATLAELSTRLTRGELSSRDLVEHYTARVEALDRRGPTLRSV